MLADVKLVKREMFPDKAAKSDDEPNIKHVGLVGVN